MKPVFRAGEKGVRMDARITMMATMLSSMDEDPFNGMSMSDKLAALVGLVPAPGGVEGEIKQDDEPEEPVPSVQVGESRSSSAEQIPFKPFRSRTIS